jgi:hypothetical protein
VVTVELGGQLIRGIDDQRKSSNVGPRRPRQRIGQQRAAHPLTLEVLIDSQPPHADGVYRRVTRQLFAGFRRKIGQQNAAGRQRVKASNALALRHIKRDKTGGDPTPDVLADLLVEIMIQRRDATFEGATLMGFVERRDPKGRLTHSGATSLRRRAKARSSAGAGWGGANSACAKHC